MPDTSGFTIHDAPPGEPWRDPEMAVLRLYRREPPSLPLDVFGPA